MTRSPDALEVCLEAVSGEPEWGIAARSSALRDDDARALSCDRIAHVRERAVPSPQRETGYDGAEKGRPLDRTILSSIVPREQLIGLSGSDLEAVLVRAVLEAESADSSQVTAEHLALALGDFIPPANSLERELQILVAVLESTSKELLPPRYRDLERAAIQARVNELKMILRA